MQSGRSMIVTMKVFILLANCAGWCQTRQTKIPWNRFIRQHSGTWARRHQIRFMTGTTFTRHYSQRILPLFKWTLSISTIYNRSIHFFNVLFDLCTVNEHRINWPPLIIHTKRMITWNEFCFESTHQPIWLDALTRLFIDHDWIAFQSTKAPNIALSVLAYRSIIALYVSVHFTDLFRNII